MNWKSSNVFFAAVILFYLLSAPRASSQTFTSTGSMATARLGHTATLLGNGKVLIAGGENASGILASAELYDPATGTFTATGSMTIARSGHTATLLSNGQVLIAGGTTNGSPGCGIILSSAEIYDPTTGTFTATGSMNQTREDFAATLLSNGKVLVAGGFPGPSCGGVSAVSSAELYDPTTGTFSATGSMNTARFSFTQTLLNNGKVLVAGGTPSTFAGHDLASAELYDPATGSFTLTGSMTTARSSGQTATLLQNGLVLIAGGGLIGQPVVFSSAELYDPTTGTFSATGNMTTARLAHTATLLSGGNVLLAGGHDASSNVLASAELFGPINGNFTVFSDFGPSMTSNSSVNGAGWCVTGNITPNCGPPVDRWVASPFTPNASFTLTQIDLGLGYLSGTNGAVIDLVDSVGGLPGSTILESWTASNLPTGCGFCSSPIVTLDSVGNVTLQTGTQYWLVAKGSAPDTLDFWWGNTMGLAGPSYESNNDGASWYTLPSGPGDLTAFDVLGTSSPPFAATGSMTTARQSPTATLLNNGVVLITGGVNGPVTLSSAELYHPALSPPTSQSVTQPLSPTVPNQFHFDNNVHNLAVQYPAGTSFSGVNMTVTAAQTPQASFQQRVAGTPFASAVCIAYDGEAGYCEDYKVSCTDTNGNSITCPSEASPTIDVKTSFDTQRPIINPGFLTTPLGTNNWTNIFNSFYLQRIDPTIKGRTRGFSEFVAVDLGATNGQGVGTLGFLAPLQQTDARIFPVGTVIPVEFQLTSQPGVSVTDAIAGITVVMLSDANGNSTSKIVLQRPAAFTYQGGSYVYSLNTKGYAPGVYNVTVYGNAFVAQQVQFTLPVSTSGVHLVTTVQSLTLNSSTNQYMAVLNVVNSGNNTADGVVVTASQLNSTSTTTTLPISLGDISSGASATVTLTYPMSAGAAGSRGALTISESYAGGSGGGGSRVTLP